jgi:tight adherence protein B
VGSLIGLLGGIGLVLMLWSFVEPARRPARVRIRNPKLVGGCVLSGLVVAVMALGLTGVPAIAAVLGVLSSVLPVALVRGREARRFRQRAELWPDTVDNLASAIRAGLSLPESLMQLGERGPDPLRPAFMQFAKDYRVSGRFDQSLDLLKARLADPVGDRVIEGLRIARDVGGGDVGRMLRTLSSFLRDDLRTRGELESRQSWTHQRSTSRRRGAMAGADGYESPA